MQLPNICGWPDLFHSLYSFVVLAPAAVSPVFLSHYGTGADIREMKRITAQIQMQERPTFGRIGLARKLVATVLLLLCLGGFVATPVLTWEHYSILLKCVQAGRRGPLTINMRMEPIWAGIATLFGIVWFFQASLPNYVQTMRRS